MPSKPTNGNPGGNSRPNKMASERQNFELSGPRHLGNIDCSPVKSEPDRKGEGDRDQTSIGCTENSELLTVDTNASEKSSAPVPRGKKKQGKKNPAATTMTDSETWRQKQNEVRIEEESAESMDIEGKELKGTRDECQKGLTVDSDVLSSANPAEISIRQGTKAFSSSRDASESGQRQGQGQGQGHYKESDEFIDAWNHTRSSGDSHMEDRMEGTDEIETSPMSRRSRREPKVPGKLLPLLECLGAITSHKFGSLFKHKLESQLKSLEREFAESRRVRSEIIETIRATRGLVENNVSVEGASYGNRTPDLSRAENNGGFNGDMRELVDLLSKLNPLAEEFIPQPHRSPSFIFNGNGSFANNGRRKKNSFNQGKRRLNGRNIRAQQEDSVRRTVYVSDIDQQVTEEQLAALFINCGQVTKLRDGVAVGIAVNHLIVDGYSTWHFIRSWADLCRGSSVICLPPSYDRAMARNTKVKLNLNPPNGDSNAKGNKTEKRPLKGKTFHFSKEMMEEIKSRANKNREGKPLSSFQSLGAHLWQAVTKARKLAPEDIALFAVLMDCRAKVSPPLPKSYFGNAIQSIKGVTSVGHLLSNDLSFAANMLQQVIDSHGANAIKQKNEEWERDPKLYGFSDAARNCVVVGSSPRFEVYENDFGWGKPVRVKSGCNNKFDGMVYLYPGQAGRGSVDVEITLLPTTMDLLESDPQFRLTN